MSTLAGVSENKLVYFTPDAVIVPIDAVTVINQGDRVKLSSGKAVPTSAKNDDWIGVADAQNPVSSLGDTRTYIKVLLKDNVVWFDFTSTGETATFGDLVYQYTDGSGYYNIQGVAKASSSATLVGTFVGLTPVASGAGVRIPVKIVPSVVI